MAKDKLRIIFNVILVIFVGILMVIGISRDIIAPKPKSSDENGNS